VRRDFVACFNPANRFERKESERFRSFGYEELQKRDKLSLDITRLRDESLEDTDNLPDPAILVAEIVEDLQAALDQFAQIAVDLAKSETQSQFRQFALIPSPEQLTFHF
jgi:type I restriction enzyme M protein